MNASKAIANELEASTIGRNATLPVSWGSGFNQRFYIVANIGCSAFEQNEMVGETGDWNENVGIYEGSTFFMECNFQPSGERIYTCYVDMTNFNINTPIVVYATSNWTQVTTPSFMPDMGTVIFTTTNGDIKGCTKQRALNFGCTVQRATNYTTNQLVRYEDLTNTSANLYAATIKNSSHIELAIDGSTVPTRHFVAGKIMTVTGQATGNYRIKTITAYGTNDSSKIPTINGNKVTMPAYPITISCTEEAGVQCVVNNPTGITISVNGNTSGIYNTTSGTTIKLTYTITSGYTFNSWKITKENGASTSFGDTFTMPDYNLIISANITAPKELNHDFVVLNVPNCSGARYGYYNSGKNVPTVSQNSLVEFKGLYDDEIALVDSGQSHVELITAAGYDFNILCQKDLGDYFFQLNEWYAVAQVAVQTDATVTISAYHWDEANQAYVLLADGTTYTVDTQLGNLYITIEPADKTRTITVMWYPKQMPSSVSDLESGNDSQLCNLMTFAYGGETYCIGFNYYGCDTQNYNNNEIVAWSSPIVSLKPQLSYSVSGSITKDFEPFYVKGPNSRFANGLRAFYYDLYGTREPFPKSGITITIPTNLLDIDYQQCYLTMTMLKIPLSDNPVGCSSDWWFDAAAKDDGITVFNTDWVDYVHSNWSGYFTEDELTANGIFGANLYNLNEFSQVTQDDFPWFMQYELNQNDATITINLNEMVIQGYQGDWYKQTDFETTLYISLIYQGQIYAWAYCPYNKANTMDAYISDCTLTPTHTGTAMQLNHAGSDYADFDFEFINSDGNRDGKVGLIIRSDSI